MKAILAVNRMGYIGLNGELPWRSPEDLAHFKNLTQGCTLLVGSVTASKLPPLPGRTMIVYNREMTIDCDAIDWCIGGKTTFEMFADKFEEVHLSVIDDYTRGDVMFPDLKNLRTDCKVYTYEFSSERPIVVSNPPRNIPIIVPHV